VSHPETIDVLDSALGAGWVRLCAPDCERPWWHDLDDPDGRRAFAEIAAALGADHGPRAAALHGQAIASLVVASAEARRGGQETRARALAQAAGRLCQEVVGLWPLSSLRAD